jgi:glycosyltransferase involved in cell wall biosynthesis
MDKNSNTYKDGLINVYPVIATNPAQLIYYISRVPILKLFTRLLFYLHNGLKIHIFLLSLNKIFKIDYIEYTEGGDFWNTITNNFKYSSHLHGSPYTFLKQSGQLKNKAYWIGRRVEHFFIRRSHTVISPCHAMVEMVEVEMGQKLKQAHVIPYPVADSEIITIKKSKKSKKVTLLFASRNDPVKGGKLLTKALGLLPENVQSKIQVEFYGYVPQLDLTHLPFLQINEFVPKEVLEKAYQTADICVIPSLFDNSPNTVYEAMANGRIVVASSVGGIPEIVGGIENGFLFDPKDVNDLVEKLEDAIKLVLEGECQSMRVNAQQRINAISNLSINVEQRLNLIHL